jgi:hypothetical protein
MADSNTYSPGGNQPNNDKQLQELIAKLWAAIADLQARVTALEHP